MQKRVLSIVFAFATMFFCNVEAQNWLDDASFNIRSSFEYNHTKTDDLKGFNGEHFNLNMQGHITENISFRFRQRFHKNIVSGNNIFNATDFLYIDWQIDKHWSLRFGRDEILIGGYEYDYAPIDVYYYSDFCNNLPECYAFGASVGYNFNADQKLIFQITNTPFKGGNSNLLSCNLAWFGYIAPWWKTIWSVNESEYADGKFENIIALGNRFEFGDWYIEADYISRYRSSFDKFLFDHFAVIGKLNYNYKNWNFFAKGGYDADRYPKAYHPTTYILDFEYDYTHIGCGAEYFPLKDSKDLRLHAVYYYNDNLESHNLMLGATWKLNLLRK